MPTKPLDLKGFLAAKDPNEVVINLSFEQGMQLLEQLVSEVEGGACSLEDSIQAYERGAALVLHLRQLLTGAEQRLKKVDLTTLKPTPTE